MSRNNISHMLILPLIFLVFNLPMLSFTAAAASKDVFDDAAAAKIVDKTDVFNLKAKSSILMDADSGNILIEKNGSEKRSIASITKIMSMLLVMEAIESGKTSFDDKVIVSEHAFSMGGSQVWLEPGEEFTVNELLKAVAIHSANDATVALAEKVAGSEEAFVAMMNEKAHSLGMRDTYFLDCSGLTDEGHYSTARDIAVMSRELIMKYPKITEYTSIWHDTFREGAKGKKPVSLDNTNKLIRFYEGANGLKTGYTSAAGYCLSASAQRGNLQLIAVVLGEPDTNTRFAEARKLLDYGFANYETTQVNSEGEVIKALEVKKGLALSVNAVYERDVRLMLKKGEKGKIDRETNIPNQIEAPVTAGQRLGEVIYKLEGKELFRVDAVAESNVQRASLLRLFIRMLKRWFGLGKG